MERIYTWPCLHHGIDAMSACHRYQLLMELVARFLTDFVFFISCFLTDAISPLLLIQRCLIPTSRFCLWVEHVVLCMLR